MKYYRTYKIIACVFAMVFAGVVGQIWYFSRPVQVDAAPVFVADAEPAPAMVEQPESLESASEASKLPDVESSTDLLLDTLQVDAETETESDDGMIFLTADDSSLNERYITDASATSVDKQVPIVVISGESSSGSSSDSGLPLSSSSLSAGSTATGAASGDGEVSSSTADIPASNGTAPIIPGGGLITPSEKPMPTWISQEGIRAGFFSSSSSTDYAKKMKAIGLNTVITTRFCYDLAHLPQIMKDYSAHAQASALAGMHMFASYVWQPGGQWASPRYRSVVFGDGTEGLFPCPLDENFWQQHMINIAVSIAEISENNSDTMIDGIFVDMEMYGTEALSSEKRYYTEDTCFCDDCFARFILDRTELNLSPVRKDRRKSWLVQYDLLTDYRTYLHERLQAKAEELKHRVHSINPNMLLGVYPRLSDENWAVTAVMRGFGKDSYPAISFTTDTYGYYPNTRYPGGANCIPDDLTDYFNEYDINGIYVAGYMLSKYTSSQIGSHLVKSCQRAQGYWIYRMQQLLETTDVQTDPLAGGSQADYLRAIKNANSALGTN